MKWRPGDCVPGDMIRVPLGGIYHYGIFASESEVIQFGLPPLPEYRDRPEAQAVTVTDMALFSCGQIVEIGVPEKEERKRRFSHEETLRRARARLGEGGYDLLRNNCEHFVWDCAFGQRKCTQYDEAIRRWQNRPVLDVYLAPIPSHAEVGQLLSAERNRELSRTKNPELRLQRYWVWKVLEYAAERSLGLRPEDLHFHQTLFGRWSCEEMEFSLSHTAGMVAAAVSKAPVGVDIENIPAFIGRYADPARHTEAMLRKIQGPGEPEEHGPAALLYAWVGKESLFKARQSGFFQPHQLLCGKETGRFVIEGEPPVMLAVSGEQREHLRFYLYTENSAQRLDREWILEGKEGLCKYFG